MGALQDLEKRDAVAEKKRESIMVNFNHAKGQMSSLEHSLKSVQVDLEKTQFALEVKKGERTRYARHATVHVSHPHSRDDILKSHDCLTDIHFLVLSSLTTLDFSYAVLRHVCRTIR